MAKLNGTKILSPDSSSQISLLIPTAWEQTVTIECLVQKVPFIRGAKKLPTCIHKKKIINLLHLAFRLQQYYPTFWPILWITVEFLFKIMLLNEYILSYFSKLACLRDDIFYSARFLFLDTWLSVLILNAQESWNVLFQVNKKLRKYKRTMLRKFLDF